MCDEQGAGMVVYTTAGTGPDLSTTTCLQLYPAEGQPQPATLRGPQGERMYEARALAPRYSYTINFRFMCPLPFITLIIFRAAAGHWLPG